MSTRIVITRPVPQIAIEILEKRVPDGSIEILGRSAPPSTDDILRACGDDCGGLLCTLGDDFSDQVITKLPSSLKVISTYAVGFNNIAVEAAKARGIVVTNTPDVLTDATAELAIALMLSCARRVVEGDQLVRDGQFKGWSPLYHLGQHLYGTTVGIFGAGRIGQRVGVTLTKGFNCQILYTSRERKAEFEKASDAQRVDFDALLKGSDFLTLHCPLTPETHHKFTAREFSLMRDSAILINTSRGPVVKEADLVTALRERDIAGAGLDVFEEEPSIQPGLANLQNVVLAPHVGSATHQTRNAMGELCANSIAEVLHGNLPRNAL